VAHAVGKLVEGLAFVQVWNMHDVSGTAELIREDMNAAGQAMGMVEEQNLSHVRSMAAGAVSAGLS
jgi:hypothetical protein